MEEFSKYGYMWEKINKTQYFVEKIEKTGCKMYYIWYS